MADMNCESRNDNGRVWSKTLLALRLTADSKHMTQIYKRLGRSVR